MTNMQCMLFDATVPECRLDSESSLYLCFPSATSTPECRIQSDCGAGRDCVGGTCRNAP